ncbi:NAD-P-binding protein [Stereum hirsutum FP-91666 SS1]|uniref:NAD-P-binding protein n=1 Tax=Stereum hirsutum (strain FP-91666) TaxID=721885 RepID=UPI000440CA03|nr:NAD-P-binding protein [Stereum hirsutum FP-91666 SS1]EIM87183.1 NAD-P-binding protein [Stereum hirsutum FP-91666 SS1]
MTSQQTTGYAILGAGIFAKEAYLPSLKNISGTSALSLKAVYSRSKSSASSLAETAVTTLSLSAPPDVYHDDGPTLDDLLSRPDISSILIMLPITTQPSIVLKCLSHNKHVLSEKPVAPSIAEAKEIIRTYETKYKPKGLLWRVAENWSTEPGFLKSRDVIAAGTIGRVHTFEARAAGYVDVDNKWYKTPWRTVPDYQGGFLLDGGVHTAAALRVILPAIPTSLSSFSSLSFAHLAPADSILAILQTAPQPASSDEPQHPDHPVDTSIRGTLHISFSGPANAPSSLSEIGPSNSITLTGTLGWLNVRFTPEGKQRVTVYKVKKVQEGDDKGKIEGVEESVVYEEKPSGVEKELERFFAAVSGTEKEDVQNPREALWDVAVIEASLKSGGQKLELAELIAM